ncbi:MAG TPA: M1 family peptidase, partial [Dokdonella sp.]
MTHPPRAFLPLLFAMAIAPVFAFAAAALPTGKLPQEVTPLRYALHLTIDPRSERFAGEARIRVKLAKATDHLWLHAQKLDISRSAATDAAGHAVAAK